MFGRKKQITPLIQAVATKLRYKWWRFEYKYPYGYGIHGVTYTDKDTGFTFSLTMYYPDYHYEVRAPVPITKEDKRLLREVSDEYQARRTARIKRVRAWQEDRKRRRFERAYGLTEQKEYDDE